MVQGLFVEKFIVLSRSRNSLHFMDFEGSLPC